MGKEKEKKMKITNLDKFMQKIGREDLLSAAEEQKYLKAIKLKL